MRLTVVVALALAVLATAFAAGPIAPNAEAQPTAIIALGDSFISGEGGRWLGNGSEAGGMRSGTDRAAYACGGWGCAYDPVRVYGASEESGCHRSDVAPIESASVKVDEQINLACSGARLANLWPAALGGEAHFGEAPQIDRLAAVAARADVRMVVVSAAANDVGFGELVADCALDWARSDEEDPRFCRATAGAQLGAALPRAERGLERALRSVRQVLADGERRSEYRLVVMGYASPFPPGRLFRYTRVGLEPAARGRLPGLERRCRLGGDGRGRGAGDRDAGGRGCHRRRVPRPPQCSRRAPALRSSCQPRRARRPLAAERGVGPSPLFHSGLGPRIAAPQRLRAARDRRLPRPALCSAARRLRLPRHPRSLCRRDADRAAQLGGAAISSTRCPGGRVTLARAAPQWERRSSTSKPCSRRRATVASKSGATTAR